MQNGRSHRDRALNYADEPLGRLPAGHQHDDAADDTDAADDRSDRNGVFLVLVNLERTKFRHVFFRSEAGEPAVGESDDADDD